MQTSSLYKRVMKRVSFCYLCHKTLWAKQFAKGCAGDFEWTSQVAVVFLKKYNSNSNKLLYKLIPPLYPQDLGATETFPRKPCREACKDTNDRAADTRSAATSSAGSCAQQPHKLHPPELLHPLLKRPGCFAFLETQGKDLYALHWMI